MEIVCWIKKIVTFAIKRGMAHDVFESISQRSRGAEDEENRRIQEIADELYRRCCLYEAQLREGQNNVRASEIEHRIAEDYAKEHGLWLSMNEVFDLGIPGPSGNFTTSYGCIDPK